MLILAVDTSSRAGSLALVRDGRVIEVLAGDASRTHGERLPREADALLARIGAKARDVDLFAVVTGPGSFTGLRVGIAAVQGFANALDRRIVPVSAFEAFALADEAGEGSIAIWRDAQRRQVFAAVYGRTGDQLTERAAAVSNEPGAVIAEWNRRAIVPDILIGDGVDLYAALVREAWPRARLVSPAPPLAPIAARLAARSADVAVRPHAVIPIYVRASDAELAAEQKKQKNKNIKHKT